MQEKIKLSGKNTVKVLEINSRNRLHFIKIVLCSYHIVVRININLYMSKYKIVLYFTVILINYTLYIFYNYKL